MVRLTIIPDGDGAWPDLKDRRFEHGEWVAVAALKGGMSGGSPSVAVRIELKDGTIVFAETSLKLFLTAADVLKARHGDPRKEESPWPPGTESKN